MSYTSSLTEPPAGLTGTYGYLWLYGGPVSIVWGWLLVGCMNFIVGLSMAEICESHNSTHTTRNGRYPVAAVAAVASSSGQGGNHALGAAVFAAAAPVQQHGSGSLPCGLCGDANSRQQACGTQSRLTSQMAHTGDMRWQQPGPMGPSR